jgi:hypothetical protein
VTAAPWQAPQVGFFDDETVAHMLVAVAPELARSLAEALTRTDADPVAVERARHFAREAVASLEALEHAAETPEA